MASRACRQDGKEVGRDERQRAGEQDCCPARWNKTAALPALR